MVTNISKESVAYIFRAETTSTLKVEAMRSFEHYKAGLKIRRSQSLDIVRYVRYILFP